MQANPSQQLDISHVHGLAYDSRSDTVLMATHHGLARGVRSDGSWTWEFVGDSYDYMGFTKDPEQAGTFYSSGHPDNPHDYGATHLGLRRSTDGGLTWEQRSLKGEVDFHALTAMPGAAGWLAGHWQGKTKVSVDGGATWTDHASPPASVLAFAGTREALLAGTSAGLFRTTDLQGFVTWEHLPGINSLVSSVAATPDGLHLLAGTGDGKVGSTFRSLDGGMTWTQIRSDGLTEAPGQVHFAFDDSDPSHAFAALAGGRLMETFDAGLMWQKVRN